MLGLGGGLVLRARGVFVHEEGSRWSVYVRVTRRNQVWNVRGVTAMELRALCCQIVTVVTLRGRPAGQACRPGVG